MRLLATFVLVAGLFVLAWAPKGGAAGPPYYGPAVLGTSGLVGYWPLDETSGTTAYDQTTSPANATYSGGVTLGQPGAIQTSTDYAVAFNGTSGYAQTASAAKLEPSKSLTLEVWFKTTSSATKPLMQLGNGAYLKLSSGSLEGIVGGTATIVSSRLVDDAAWHYAVLTWNGSTVALYLDGALAAPLTGYANPVSDTTAPTLNGTVLFGKDNQSNYFSGSLDEVAVYGSSSDSSGALQPGQIANHYAAALTGPVQTPVDVVAPTVTGSPLVGSTLNVASNGSWNSSSEIYGALSYSYQWERCAYDGSACGPISGATSSSYSPASADNDHALAVKVTASNSSASASATVKLSTVGGYRSQVLSDGGSNLLGYWPLDEQYSYPYNQSAADISSNPANGTYNGNGVTLDAAGAINDGTDTAATFASSYVAATSTTKFEPTKSLTLEVWFKTSSATTQPIFQVGAGTGALLKLYNGMLEAWVDGVTVISSNTYSDGRWHYAALTWDGSKVALYADGAPVTPLNGYSNPANGSAISLNGNVLIGKDNQSNYYTGSVDDAALYGSSVDSSGALSAAEIANHYQLNSYQLLLQHELYGGGNPSIPGVGCGCGGAVADPVDTSTGDFSVSATDVSVTSYGPAVSFSRSYDAFLAQQQAQSGTPGVLGYGWSDNWNMSLSNGTNVLTVTQQGGAQVNFYPPVSGSCPAPYVGPGTAGTYCALPDVTASLTYNSGTSSYTFVTRPYESYTFNSSGKLMGESGPGGAAMSISYNSPSPGAGSCPSTAASCETITSASGRALVIASNSSGEITKVVDPLGRSWTYAYCAPPSTTCSSNDLVSVTDPMGHVTSYTYDEPNSNANLKHDMLTVTKPNGQTGGPDAGDKVVNVYDSQGRVTSQTDPAGNQTTIDYSNFNSGSGSGYVISTDPDGNQTKITYQNGVLVDTQAGYGQSSSSTTQFEPDSSSLLDTTVVDPNGHPSEYAYNANGDTTSSTNQLGNTSTSSFNSFDEQTCSATPLATSACSSLTPPTAMSPGGTVTPPSSAPPAYVTYYEYDTSGNLIWTEVGGYNPGDSSPEFVRTTYNLYNGDSVTLGGTLDACTNTAPSGSLPCATINGDGVVTQLGYDSAGDLTSSSTPDGTSGGEVARTTYAYDGDGERTSATSPDGNLPGATAANYTTTTAYNNDGQVTSQIVGSTGSGYTARVTSYGYDADGNQTSVTDPRNKTTTYTFNADDEQTLVTDPDSQATLTCYDGDGNVTETVPPVGVAANSLTPASCPTSYPSGYGDRLASDATTDTFNYQGQKTSETTPAPAGLSGYETTTYAYDADGNLTTVTAPPTSTTSGAPNQVTQYTYDEAGELLTETTGYGTSAASTTSYCYGPTGAKTAVVPPDGNASGTPSCSSSSPYQTTSAYQTGYSYDSLGELVSTTTPSSSFVASPTTTVTYDAAGNALTTTDPAGVTKTDTYTPLNQLATVTYSGSSAPSVSYSYDASGNKVSMTDGTGTSTYSYDPFNELTAYENGAGNAVSYTYNDNGKVTGITYPLGTGATWASTDTVSYGYDNADELTSIGDFSGHSISLTNTADGLPNSITLASSGDTLSTTYAPTDSPSQIKLANSSSTLLQFDYSDEPSGAIASETDTPSWTGSPATYTYDVQGRVTQMAPGTNSALNYAFDASGNPTTLPTGASGTYDHAAELTSTVASGATTTFTYDSDGRRTQESQTGSTLVNASYDGAGLLASYSDVLANMSSATYDGGGLRQSETTTPSGGTAVTEYFTWNPTASTPQLLMDSGSAYIYGGAGTPIEKVNLSSGAVDYLVADALGSIRGIVNSSTGSLIASTSYDAWGNPETSGGVSSYTAFGYAGGYTDATGLSYLINRYYDPTTGQFLTVDPMASQTVQPYAYATDNPVSLSDPAGLWTLGICGGLSAILGGDGYSGSACLTGVVTGEHQIGLVLTGGGGPAFGLPSVAASVYFEVSNATRLEELSGPFYFFAASVNLGFGGSAIVFTNGPIIGVGVGVSLGPKLGPSGVAGVSETTVVTFGGVFAWLANHFWQHHRPGGINAPALLRWARLEIKNRSAGVSTLGACKIA